MNETSTIMTGQRARAARGAAVEVKDISRNYGAYRALDNVSLSIREGELMAFLGPSGSGKTTLLNIIAGFDQPSSGEVRSQGRSLTSLAPHRRDIGMVFQRYTLFPHMSVYRNVEFPLKVRNFPVGERPGRVGDVLRLVRMEGFDDRRPSELSGGQQQRVALARGLVYEPSLILMDEPLGALDKKLREEIQDEIKDLHSRLGVTIIYVTHDQEEALRLSDRITILNKGKIEQTGVPRELYEQPASLFVADFMGNSSTMRGVIESIDNGVAWIRLGCGTMVRSERGAEIGVGGKVVVVVRQEHLSLSSGAGLNQVPVTVHQTVFLGGLSSVDAMTRDGERLTAKSQTTGGSLPAGGAEVMAAWDPARTMVFPAPVSG
ncbi:MAG: ABC transporter ATP-binding protein [Pseudomonadota bacterium]|jgi:putative spermidine/putrescine transport system ATP-binding protein